MECAIRIQLQYDQAHSRWRLHDLVRDVAWQRLEATGEGDAARRRYAYSESLALANLSNAYIELGNTQRAINTCSAALTIAQAIRDRQSESYGLSHLARAQVLQGDSVQATTTFMQALTLFHENGDRWGEVAPHRS